MLKKLVSRLKSDERLFIALLVFAMAVWGGSWTSAKVVAGSVHPLVLTFLRFLIAFLCFVPMAVKYRAQLKIDRRTFFFTAAGAVLMNLYSFLFFAGLIPGQPGAGGVLVTSLNPVFTFLLSLLFYRKKIGVLGIIGLALGVAGGLVLLEIWKGDLGALLGTGSLIFVAAAVVWALLTVVSGEAQKKASVFIVGFYMYGLCSLIGLACALPFGLEQAFTQTPGFWANLVYLGAASTFFATSIYFFAAKKISARRASSFSLFTPVFAVLTSLFFIGEIPTPVTIIGGLLAMTAIYLLNRKPRSEIITPKDGSARERPKRQGDTVGKRAPGTLSSDE